jgi:hypothetical protein
MKAPSAVLELLHPDRWIDIVKTCFLNFPLQACQKGDSKENEYNEIQLLTPLFRGI